MDRRTFLTQLSGGVAFAAGVPQRAGAEDLAPDPGAGYGMLVDTTVCIGCRKCEYACAQEHSLSTLPLESFEDVEDFEQDRRMAADAYTVVNRRLRPDIREAPFFVKHQCMHCLQPACVSACLVGALARNEGGAVVYDAWKCMGCRYCMVACPFEVPAYEYFNPTTPVIRKCTLCFDRQSAGQIPACAEMCPPMALTFGKRSELLQLAHEKIAAEPGRYVNRIYGETEVGGTGWLYLSAIPFEDLGLPPLDNEPVPALTETIQHSVFKYGLPPLMLFGLLAAIQKAALPDGTGGPASGRSEWDEEGG